MQQTGPRNADTNSVGLSIHTRGRQAAAAVVSHHCLSRVVMEGHPSGMGKHRHQMQRAHTMIWSLKVQLACVFSGLWCPAMADVQASSLGSEVNRRYQWPPQALILTLKFC